MIFIFPAFLISPVLLSVFPARSYNNTVFFAVIQLNFSPPKAPKTCFSLDFWSFFGYTDFNSFGEEFHESENERVFAKALCLAQPVDFFIRATQLMNTRCLSAILAAVFLAAGLPSVANATLADDSTAITFGQTPPFSYTATTPNLFGHVDYAVYAPGNYSGSLSFPADQYVYCYQIFVSSTSGAIGFFTVNLDSDATAYSQTSDTASASGVPGGSVPTSSSISVQNDFVTYNFARTAAITANNHSVVLLFTSDFAPQLGEGIVSGAFPGSVHIELPTPTPEPASVLLLALASPVLLRIRRRKS